MLTGIATLGKGYSTYKGILHGQFKNVFGKGKDIDVTKDYFVDFKKDVLPQESSYSTTQHHLLKTKDKIIRENEQVFAGKRKKTNYPLTEDEVKDVKGYFKHRVGKSDAQINDQFKLAKFVNETFKNEKTVPPWKGDNVFETVFRKNNPDFSYKKLRSGPEGQPSAGKLELNELIKRLHKDELVTPEAFKNLNAWNKIRREKSGLVAFQNRLDNMKSLYKEYSVKVPKTALDENPNAQSIADYKAFVKSWEETTGKTQYYSYPKKRIGRVDKGPEIARGFTAYVKAFNGQTGRNIPTPHEYQKLFSSRPLSSKIGSDKFIKRQKTTLKSSPELHAMMDDPKYSKMIKRVFGDRFERLHVLGEALEGRQQTFGAMAKNSQLRKIKNLMTRYEMIPEEFVDKIRRPQIAGTKQQNQTHIDIEYPLIEALVRQFDILGYTFTPHGKVRGTGRLKAGGTWSPESTRTSPLTAAEKGELSYLDLIIKDAHNALERSGLETTFYSPINKKLITFGKRPHNIFQLRKRFLDPEDILVRNKGGLINGDLTDTIAPERGPMPEGLPLLDPLESIDRSRRQHFQVGGFANLFGKLGRVPKAVGRFGDIKKPSLAKPKATTEVVVGQAVEDKPAMFLETVRVLEEAPDTKLTPDEWLSYVKGKGVSAVELDEFGLEPLLNNMMKPKKGSDSFKAAEANLKAVQEEGKNITRNFSDLMKRYKGDKTNPEVISATEAMQAHKLKIKQASDVLAKLKAEERAATPLLSKSELIENYNREMPKIDMDIAIAEPVSRGGKDLAKMLLDVREKRGPSHYDDQVDIFSNDARLLTDLHQPPQDRVGFVLRGKLIDIMKGTTKVAPRADQEDQIIKLLEPTGRQAYHFQTRDSVFKELWEKAFPNLFHTTNNIVKQGYRDELATLVPSQDVTKLSIAKNISEEQAFEELYQALNIFDRQVMTADVPIPFWTKKLLYRLGDMSEGRGFFYKSKRTPAHEGAQFIPGGSGYGELKFYQNFDTGAVRAKEADYRSGHFSGEVFQGNTGNSPFGWLRFSERIDESGRKILMAEEIQSDLHQAVAQKGYNYAPRLDKHDVLAEMGEFAKQLDTKKQTLESTRLRKDAIKALPRVERESEANVAELKNIEKAIKKLIGDVKKLQKKVEAQAKATGRSGQVHPDTAFKKSENYAKLFMQGLMKMANDKGYDGVALSTGKMKKAHGAIPKGGDKFYDEIGVKAMKKMAKKSGFNFTDTTIVDGNGFTWEKIPLIEMRDINTGIKIPGEATIPVYKKGGIVNKKMVKK